MIIKDPAVYDVSHWKEILDFTKVNPKPFLFITKATEGTGFVDSKFVRFFRGMASIGVFRGAYHFNRKAYGAQAQAQHFCNTVRPELVDSDLVILDVEEGGESAANLISWFQYVHTQFPKNIMVIYSRKNILDSIPMTQTQKDYFRNNVVTWTAGYPSNPDIYSVVPSFYVPDQTKYAPVGLWQYSEKGVVAGIDGSVDLNWISEELKTRIGGAVTPPPKGETMFYKCVKDVSIRNNTNYPNNSVIGVLKVGDIVEGEMLTNVNPTIPNWVHFSKIFRVGGSVETFDGYSSGHTTYLQETTDPNPPPVGAHFLATVIVEGDDGKRYGWENAEMPEL